MQSPRISSQTRLLFKATALAVTVLAISATLAGAEKSYTTPAAMEKAIVNNPYYPTLTRIPWADYSQRDIDLSMRYMGCEDISDLTFDTKDRLNLQTFLFIQHVLTDILVSTGKDGKFLVHDELWSRLNGHQHDLLFACANACEHQPELLQRLLYSKPILALPYEINRFLVLVRCNRKKEAYAMLSGGHLNQLNNYFERIKSLRNPVEGAVDDFYRRRGIPFPQDNSQCTMLTGIFKSMVDAAKTAFPPNHGDTSSAPDAPAYDLETFLSNASDFDAEATPKGFSAEPNYTGTLPPSTPK